MVPSGDRLWHKADLVGSPLFAAIGGAADSEARISSCRFTSTRPTPRRLPDRRRLARALAQAAAGREAGQAMEQLVPGPQHEAEGPRHAVAADRELAHGLGHLPDAVAAGREESHVARTQAMDLSVLVGHQHFTRNDVL